MHLHQWGILIQIAGFVLVGVFGGILLNREMVARFGDRVASLLAWINRKLARVPDWRALKPVLKYTAKALLTVLLISFVVVGLINDKLWLFFIGLTWLSIGLVASALVFVILEKRPLHYVPKHILETAVNTAIMPIMILVLMMLGVCLRILRDTIKWLAREDALKKLLIWFGTGMILVGLILQFMASIHST